MGPPRPGPLPPSTSATHEYRLDRATNKNHHSLDPQRRRAVADIRSEPRPASDRNRWPASYWNTWPASSDSAPSMKRKAAFGVAWERPLSLVRADEKCSMLAFLLMTQLGQSIEAPSCKRQGHNPLATHHLKSRIRS